MSNEDRRRSRTFFLTTRDVSVIRRLADLLGDIERHRLPRTKPDRPLTPGAVASDEPCQGSTVIQVCDAKITFKEKIDAFGQKMTWCTMQPSLDLTRGSSFCLCNETDWKIEVQFLDSDRNPCPRVVASGTPVEIESGGTAEFRITDDGDPAECYVKIRRWIDGAWVECVSGSGGGPDLEIDDPGP